MIDATNINTLFGSLIVEELIRSGVDYFCISPGSRSAPLAVAVARNPRAKSIVILDERAAAFHALGYARATGKPAALICTSGTAPAHYLPAVIEADAEALPMLMLTADRPPELRMAGANQAVPQVGIFGERVRWSFDLPCPDEKLTGRLFLTAVDQALHRALCKPAGPVHLNCMFREPLAPTPVPVSESVLADLSDWAKSDRPFTTYAAPTLVPADSAIRELTRIIAGGGATDNAANKRDDNAAREQNDNAGEATGGIVVVGRLQGAKERAAVLELCAFLNCPVFADIASGLRLGAKEDFIIPFYDLILLDDWVRTNLRPAWVLHLGGQPTSKRLLQFLDRPGFDYIVVKDHPFRHDPLHRVTLRIQADPAAPVLLGDVDRASDVTQRLAGKLASPPVWFGDVDRAYDVTQRLAGKLASPQASAWLKTWQRLSAAVEGVIDYNMTDTLGAIGGITAGADKTDMRGTTNVIGVIAAGADEQTPDKTGEAGLFLASSMAIREMDMYGSRVGNRMAVAANRGASGIEGVVASAAGYAAGLGQDVTLYTGDLSLLHDLNSLALLGGLGQKVIIVLINNRGGGIFSYLPIAKYSDVFEPYFNAPHEIDFEPIVRAFGLEYYRPDGPGAFRDAYREAQRPARGSLIEVRADPDEEKKSRAELQAKIIAALQQARQCEERA